MTATASPEAPSTQSLIPILDLTRQYQQLKQQFDEAVVSVMTSGAFILGPEVIKLEQEVAQYLGVKHAIGVASGSDALYLAMRALNIGPGDEVITTPFTYIATSEAIVEAEATPVFVDLNPDGSFNMDVAAIEALITPQTKAILPVHLYGQAVDMEPLMALAKKHNLSVVEDCAQSFGTEYHAQKVGAIGDIGCFSFFPTKNLGCFGDGGLVTTNCDELAAKLKMLRVHGSQKRYYHEVAGINSRLDSMQAAILRVKLPHIDNWNARRKAIAQAYSNAFQNLPGVTTPMVLPNTDHVFHQYTLRFDPKVIHRDTVMEALKAANVQSMIYYPVPLHQQGTHQNLNYKTGDFPITEQFAEEVLSLPIFPEMTEDEQNRIIQAIQQAVQ